MSALSDLDDDMENAPVTPRFGNNILDSMPDGWEGDIEMVHLDIKDETKSGPIVVFELVVLGDDKFSGKKGELAFFLTKKVDSDSSDRVKDEGKISEVKAALIKMGFDVPNWKVANGRPFSAMLHRAADLVKGIGIKIKLKKGGDKKQFNNVTFGERSKKDGRPATFGPEEMKAAPEPFSV
jgi:hypothetical protein